MDTERNATAAQAVARWLVAHSALTGRMEQVQHVADSLGVGTVQTRNYLAARGPMTEPRLVDACNRFGLAVWYHPDTGWICSAIEDNATAEQLHAAWAAQQTPDSATGWTVEEVSDADRE